MTNITNMKILTPAGPSQGWGPVCGLLDGEGQGMYSHNAFHAQLKLDMKII